MRIGIFGGTFDPPHLGHLILASEAYYQLSLDRIYFVLTPVPPHKKLDGISTVIIRLEMLRLAILHNPTFELIRVDIDRPPPHYAVDTMKILSEKYPEESLYYLMGGDSLHDLPTWYNPQEFIKHCAGIGVMHRPGEQVELERLEATLQGITEKVTIIDAPLLEISSADIRRRIELDLPFRYYLPERVYRYLLSHNIYK